MVLWLVIWAAGATKMDWLLLHLIAWPSKQPRTDLLLLLRIWGSLWTWTLIALVVKLQQKLGSDHIKAPPTRHWQTMLLSPATAGAIAEGLKLLIRRERPSDLEIYMFKAWNDQPWSTKELGLPSSHAAVAFAGSMAIGLLYPRLKLPAMVMAVGCAYTRVASGSHFPSDVVAGAAVGLITGLVVVRSSNGGGWPSAKPSGCLQGRADASLELR
jgi:membrane-associated phospholipid phosphatase